MVMTTVTMITGMTNESCQSYFEIAREKKILVSALSCGSTAKAATEFTEGFNFGNCHKSVARDVLLPRCC